MKHDSRSQFVFFFGQSMIYKSIADVDIDAYRCDQSLVKSGQIAKLCSSLLQCQIKLKNLFVTLLQVLSESLLEKLVQRMKISDRQVVSFGLQCIDLIEHCFLIFIQLCGSSNFMLRAVMSNEMR